jgi:hypothetical protein
MPKMLQAAADLYPLISPEALAGHARHVRTVFLVTKGE